MREIKFRAWDGRKMHKVCRLGLNGYSHDLWSASAVSCRTASNANVQIMQYTGLKDKNGKEIYESDLVSVEVEELFSTYKGIGEVVWFDNSCEGCALDFPNKGTCIMMNAPELNTSDEWEVVGNIYENSELLKI